MNLDESNFSGTIPLNYDDYLGPMFFEPYAAEIPERVDPSSIKVAVELGCGTGRVTKHLRKALSKNATLIASDISQDMLSVAQSKIVEQEIDWRIIDAGQLPFKDSSIDLLVCYFGYMFVPDKEKAFSEAYRVLRTGGSFLIATWDSLEKNEVSHVFRVMVKKYLGDTLPDSFKLPFSMSNPDHIISSLNEAGFEGVQCEKVVKVAISETASKAAQGLVRGGLLYNEIQKRNPALENEIVTSVANELAQKFGSEPMKASMSALVTHTRK